jgi:hypothetical protein
MPHATEERVDTAAGVETLDRITSTPVGSLTAEQVRPIADRIVAKHRRRSTVAVSKFNSGL